MLMNKAGGSSVVRTQRRFRCLQEVNGCDNHNTVTQTDRNHSARRARLVAATRTRSHPAAGGVTAPTLISIRLPLPLLLLGHVGTADAEVGAVAEVDTDTDTRGLGIRRPLCACGKGHSNTSFSLVTFFRPNLGGLRVASYRSVRPSQSSVLSEEEMCGRRWASRRTLMTDKGPRRPSRPRVGGW
ncbi:hypothetical protein EDB85DRAFT_1970205 [Lactarius pseudohatsudake]|nr:hypothetical protein EDB85DRAFT_1970205 [Lactarius pseudohatsudake]